MISINGREVRTVADLQIGDRLPTPGYHDGYIEIASIEPRTTYGGTPMIGINWLHDAITDPNAAPSLFLCHSEIGQDESGMFTIIRKRPRRTPCDDPADGSNGPQTLPLRHRKR